MSDMKWSEAGKGALSGAGIGTSIMPGIGTAIGAGIGGLGGFFSSLFTNNKNESLMRESWAREDNAVQRRVADLKAAGLSPTLAAGSPAASSPAIALKNSGDSAMQGISAIGNLFLQNKQLDSQREIAMANILAQAPLRSSQVVKNYSSAGVDNQRSHQIAVETRDFIASSESRLEALRLGNDLTAENVSRIAAETAAQLFKNEFAEETRDISISQLTEGLNRMISSNRLDSQRAVTEYYNRLMSQLRQIRTTDSFNVTDLASWGLHLADDAAQVDITVDSVLDSILHNSSAARAGNSDARAGFREGYEQSYNRR